jgi:hypothetical protein
VPRKVKVHLPPFWENRRAESDQRRMLTAPTQISLGATATKVGKTFGGSIWITDQAFKHPGGLGWWVGPYRKTARIGFERVKSLLPPGRFVANESDLMIIFPNKCRVEFRTAEIPDTLFGEGVMFGVGDELPRWREKAWTAFNTTMLQTQGPMRLFGNTDKGRRHFFYRLFMEGRSGNDSTISSHHIRASEAPHFMPGGFPGPIALERARRRLSPIDYAALIEAEFPEDAATVFPGLGHCIVDNWGGARFGELPFLVPPIEGGIYLGGLDLANRRNYTVLTVIEALSGLVVYWERMRHVPWREQVQRVREVQDVYGCPWLVDATRGSVGDPILERLQEEGIAADGFGFTNASKGILIETLAVQVANGEISIPRALEVLIFELESFEREVTINGFVRYHAPNKDNSSDEDDETATDDAVISLALAVYQRRTVSAVELIGHAARHPERGGASRSGFLRGR